MKRAKRLDYYRRAFEKPGMFQVTQVHCSDAPGLGTVQLNLTGRIAILCGANGAGKTTLLQLLSNLFTSADGKKVEIGGAKLEGSSATATYLLSDEPKSIECSFDSGVFVGCSGERDPDLSVVYLDAASRIKEIEKLLREQENFDEIIEGLEANELNAKELLAYNFVLNREYTKIKIFEVDVFDNFGTFPYFEVEVDGVSYDSTTAGHGELAIMLTLWELQRLPNNSPTLLLLEEPETNVSARSQSAIIDTIVMYTTIRKLFVVISTHSPNIVSQIPNANIKFILRTPGGLHIVEDPSDLKLESTLGKTPRFRGIALVEDEVAQMYVREIFRRFDGELLRIFDLINAKSESGITSILKSFPILPWLTIDGIYDGDMRSNDQVIEAISDSEHTGRFLPLVGPIEAEFKTLVLAYPDKFARMLGISLDDLRGILAEIAGRDIHDWFTKLSRLTHIPEMSLIAMFVDLQVQDEKTTKEIGDFVISVREAATESGK